jgi:hypothetical protein
MASTCGELARLWVDTYGEQILYLPKSKLVEIANQCIETGLVPYVEKLNPEDGDGLLAAVKAALADAARARAVADAALPALTGTAKQVRWAAEIRSRAIQNARMFRRRAKQRQDERVVARLDEYLANVLQKKSDALWFINNRWVFADFPGVLRQTPEFLPEERTGDAEQVARAEMTLYPAGGTHNRRTEIVVSGDSLLLLYPRDYDFLGIVDRHRLQWDPGSLGWRWKPDPGEPVADQAAALAAEFLANGYEVMVSDDAARAKARQAARQSADGPRRKT